MELTNIADLKDPLDTEGRTYREINLSTKHNLSIGDLVELDDGQRLFIARLTRDCDATPLYELEPPEGLRGYSEDSLKVIK